MSGENTSSENVVENTEAKKDGADQPEKPFLDPDKVGSFQFMWAWSLFSLVCYRQMKWLRLNSRRGMGL